VGPWNLGSYRIEERDGRIWVDEQPLLFFHFSSLNRVAPWLYNTNLASWHVRPLPVVRRRIVGAYIAALEQAPRSEVAPSITIEPYRSGSRGPSWREWTRRKALGLARIISGLIAQDHLVVVRNRVL
jgi:hypothetical protein